MKTIKIFGLPRSCTNVTEVAIKANFKTRILTNFPDWKHGKNTMEGRSLVDKERRINTDDLVFVVCTKSPYSWFISITNFENRTKRKKHLSLEESIKGSFMFHYKDKNPIEMYNTMNSHWMTMFDNPYAMQQVKAEDMANDQPKVLIRLQKNFKLANRKKTISPILKRVNPSAKVGGREFVEKDPAKLYNKELLKYINKRLDPEVMDLMGYDYLS